MRLFICYAYVVNVLENSTSFLGEQEWSVGK